MTGPAGLEPFEAVAGTLPDDPDAEGTAVLAGGLAAPSRPPGYRPCRRLPVRQLLQHPLRGRRGGGVRGQGRAAALGVLLLASVFHRSPALVEVHLTNPNTEVSLLRTRSAGRVSEAGHDGLRVTPTDFTYVPYYPAGTPFTYELGKVPVSYLPSVILTNRREFRAGEDRASLDTLLIGDDPDGPVPAWEILQGKVRPGRAVPQCWSAGERAQRVRPRV